MNKKNLILASVLAVLVIFAYIYQGPLQNSKSRQEKNNNFLLGLQVDDINKIEITNQGKVTKLEKVDGKWRVEGTKDFWITEDLTGQIKEASEVNFEIIGKNKDKKDEFNTGETGIKIKLSQNDNILDEFIMGKMANDFISSYVSKADSDNTYSIKVAGLNSTFSKLDWYDKTIFSSNKADIIKLRLQYPDKQLVIEKDGEEWKGTEPNDFEVDKEKIETILNMMTNLRAIDIPVQSFEKTGFEKNELIVQVTGENGFDNTLMVGSKFVSEGEEDERELYYAKKGNSDNIYLISKEEKDELIVTVGDLK
ncbi:DUF4340 domain-containing protein [Candidatus Parcubacteria bacterium]|nr:DUF4340 domain-containing protein [Candidatus Parcubacteria bacterium]